MLIPPWLWFISSPSSSFARTWNYNRTTALKQTSSLCLRLLPPRLLTWTQGWNPQALKSHKIFFMEKVWASLKRNKGGGAPQNKRSRFFSEPCLHPSWRYFGYCICVSAYLMSCICICANTTCCLMHRLAKPLLSLQYWCEWFALLILLILAGLGTSHHGLKNGIRKEAAARFQQSYSRGESCCVEKEVSKGLTLKTELVGAAVDSSVCVRSAGRRLDMRICPGLHGNTSYGSICSCIAKVLWAAWYIDTLLKTQPCVCPRCLIKVVSVSLMPLCLLPFYQNTFKKKALLAHIILMCSFNDFTLLQSFSCHNTLYQWHTHVKGFWIDRIQLCGYLSVFYRRTSCWSIILPYIRVLFESWQYLLLI